MSMHDLRERQVQARAKVYSLREKIQANRSRKADIDVATYTRQIGRQTVRLGSEFRLCKTLQGHTGKIYSLDWAYHAEDRIVSASGDGRLIVWNGLTSQKTHWIRLPCQWVMACAFSPSGKFVACGGLDNICSIFSLESHDDADGNRPVYQTLTGHKAYLSSCCYIPYEEAQILTSSGDDTCILWDAEQGQRVTVFGGDSSSGHTAAVMSVAAASTTPQIFLSGSCDKTARLWDMRTRNATQTFQGHDGDVNNVCFMPMNNVYFGTASDDGTCRVFDTRTGHPLQIYRHPNGGSVKVLAVAFSNSGHLLFSSYDNGDCYIWDAMTAEVTTNLRGHEGGHTKRVSCLALVRDGSALCTGSWDNNLKIWAFSHGRQT